jgi:hypothetical protein
MRSILILLLTLTTVSAQEGQCPSSSDPPSLDMASEYYRSADVDCALLELEKLLASDSLDGATVAGAHMLRAAIYYVETEDDRERRQKVRRELVAGYRADINWSGSFEIRRSDFLVLASNTRDMVTQVYAPDSVIATQPTDSSDTLDSIGRDTDSSPWYRRWWAIGSGVGAVVLVAGLMLGGDDDPPPIEEPRDTLPGFPDPPGN